MSVDARAHRLKCLVGRAVSSKFAAYTNVRQACRKLLGVSCSPKPKLTAFSLTAGGILSRVDHERTFPFSPFDANVLLDEGKP